jgi:MoaA/NifB/PqqE/SkfB family radical SAM enzyme
MNIKDISNKLSLITPRLVMKKPMFLTRMLLRPLIQYYCKTKPLRSVLFHTHYKCNFNCRHCYETNFNRTNEAPLTLSEKKKYISDCLTAGALTFDFVSGESSLDPDLPELVKACNPKKTYITLASNGYGFTEEKIRSLLNMGIDKINVSIDSWDPEIHDNLRGQKGAYRSAFKTIKLCQKVGMTPSITIFVYKNFTKAADFNSLVNYSIKHKIRTGFKTAIPLGGLEGDLDSLITQEDRNVLHILHQKHPFLQRTCVGSKNSTCPAFYGLITITAYGDVLPCNAAHFTFGNLRRDDLATIINKGRKVKYFNESYTGCPPSDDEQFIESYLSKTYDSDPYPVKAEKVFSEIN